MDNGKLLKRVEEIEAREAIRDRLHLYCRGIDRREPELIRSTFWSDSKVEYGIYSGNGIEFSNGISGWLNDAGLEMTTHLLGNVTIAVDGDAALCESYLYAYHRIRPDDGQPHDCLIGGRYHDRFERRGDVWRISFRRLVYDWFRDWSNSGDWSLGTLGLTQDNATLGKAASDVWPELNAALRTQAARSASD